MDQPILVFDSTQEEDAGAEEHPLIKEWRQKKDEEGKLKRKKWYNQNQETLEEKARERMQGGRLTQEAWLKLKEFVMLALKESVRLKRSNRKKNRTKEKKQRKGRRDLEKRKEKILQPKLTKNNPKMSRMMPQYFHLACQKRELKRRCQQHSLRALERKQPLLKRWRIVQTQGRCCKQKAS